MSLILDALNRSRQDAQQMPGLDSRHYSDGIANSGNRRQLVPWLALFVAVLVIAWLLLDKQSAPAVEVTGTAQTSVAGSGQGGSGNPGMQTAPRPVAQPLPQPVPAAPASTPVAEAERPIPAMPEVVVPESAPKPTGDASSIADLYRQQETVGEAAAAATATTGPAAAIPTTAAPTTATPTTATPELAADQSPAGSTESTAREEEVLDLEQLVARAQDEVQDARLAEHEAPFIAALSQQTKNGIPTIFYQRHDYSGVAAKSSVVLNGKTLRTGGSSAGVKVEEILPDSVVLSYKGTQFRLRALNSWVNL